MRFSRCFFFGLPNRIGNLVHLLQLIRLGAWGEIGKQYFAGYIFVVLVNNVILVYIVYYYYSVFCHTNITLIWFCDIIYVCQICNSCNTHNIFETMHALINMPISEQKNCIRSGKLLNIQDQIHHHGLLDFICQKI